MNEFVGIYTKEERDRQIRREFSKLYALYRDDDNPANEQVKRLSNEAAFMRVMLLELREIITRDGMIESYQNGANQYGLKKSSAVEVYDKMISQYMRVFAQINKLLPEPVENDQEVNELLAFISGGNRQTA